MPRPTNLHLGLRRLIEIEIAEVFRPLAKLGQRVKPKRHPESRKVKPTRLLARRVERE